MVAGSANGTGWLEGGGHEIEEDPTSPRTHLHNPHWGFGQNKVGRHRKMESVWEMWVCASCMGMMGRVAVHVDGG